MENKTIKQNANNIMWVEYWIQKAHPSFEDYELLAERYDDYRWICEIKLPLIEKSVKSISEKEVNAMLNASEKAAKLINEYMKEHPELKIINIFKGKRWEITSDETGKFISTGMSSAWRKELGKQMEKMFADSFAAVEKVIAKLNRILGSDEHLFFQVVSKNNFSEDSDNHDIFRKIYDSIAKEYGDYYGVGSNIIDNHVITIGFTPNKKEDNHKKNRNYN